MRCLFNSNTALLFRCLCSVGRTSDARPYDNAVFSNYAAVGAAIGRPSVNIRSDEKKSASAVKTIPVITGRATEKSAAAGRTSDARPYDHAVFSNYAAVGAAIGRPSVNIRSDEKKSASAVKTIPVITGRATEKSAAAGRTSDARPYGGKIYYCPVI